MHSNSYTFRFAATVTIVCSVLLASAATLLKPRQIENEKLDIKKNIISSVGITPEEGKSFSRQDINRLFKENIKGLVIDGEGNIIEDKNPENIDPKKDVGLLPLYERVQNGQVTAYIVPVSGKGLWSTIYGYMALEPDMSTVVGITFYKHGETPGLGGEIEKDWFCNNFVGKRIRNEKGELVSIEVVKGKVADKYSDDQAYHYVDGISGATLTGRGLTRFLKEDLRRYEPFFKKVLTNEGGV